MKIKDLPKNTNLQMVKVLLPDGVFKNSSLPMYNLKTKEVYLQGWTMGDFFVKLDLKSKQIYPMFWGASGIPDGIEEWEVITK